MVSDRIPDNFSWVVEGVLAAVSKPYDSRKALEFFKDEGIDVIISLTKTSLSEPLISDFGFEYHHIPVEDFGVPSDAQIDGFVSIVARTAKAGRKAIVHCFAGRGRTGTMLACYLVSKGMTANAALEKIRRLRPGSVETPEQEESVRWYARRLGRQES